MLPTMGTPFTPAITLPSSLALLATDARSKPDASQRVQAWALQHVLERDPPGFWGGDRYEQTNHYTGVIGLAIKAYLDTIGASKFTLLRRTKKVRKSAGVGHYSRDEEYEPVGADDHPLAAVLENPGGVNGVWTLAQECAFLCLQHLLTGEAPAWTPVNDAGKPVRFFALTSALTQPEFGAGVNPDYPHGAYRVTPYAGQMSAYYAANGLGNYARLPGEEVARFREYHPWARNLGMSRLQVGSKEIDCLEAIVQSRWAMFDSGMQLDTLAIVPGLSEDESKAFQAKMTRKHGGARNARQFAVMGTPPGEMSKPTIQTFGQSAREMDYQNSYDQAAGVVLALFKVPKGIAGFTSYASYAQLYAEKQQFRELGVLPYLGNLSVFLTQALARRWEDEPGEFKIEVEAPPLGDLEMEEKKFRENVTTGIVTYNQARKHEGLDPVGPDGDVPAPLYLKILEQKLMPQQAGAGGGMPPDGGDPAAAAPGEEPDGGGEGLGDPLAALLGGAPNPDSEGTGSPKPVAKSVSDWYWHPVLKARVKREEGAVWNVGENWYTKKNGKTVKTRNPNAQKPAPKETAKDRKLREKAEKEAITAKEHAAVKAVAAKIKAGGADLTLDDVGTLDAHMTARMNAAEVKALAKVIGAKLSAPKAKQAEQLIAWAKAKASGEPTAAPAAAKEKPKPAAKPAKPKAEPKPKPAPKPAKPKPAPAKPKPKEEPVAAAPEPNPAPQPAPKPAPAAKAEIPAGHEVAGEHDGGAVVARDPKSGHLTTHFAPGEPARQAARLGDAIDTGMMYAKLFPEGEDGLVPLGLLAGLVKQYAPKGTTDSDVLAALYHLRDTRAMQAQVLNETNRLTDGTRGMAPLTKDRATATLWENGKPLHFWRANA